jgi:reactive intermediate/imine deaminase
MDHTGKKEIRSTNAPAPAGPYSQALICGNLVFLSGQRPVCPQTGSISNNLQEQTRQVLLNLQSVLAEAGLSLQDVVRTNVYLSDIANFAAMNEVYQEFFSEPYPVRTTVGAQLRGIMVEIDAIAVKNSMKCG